ncbi:MAG: chain length determinant protein EpsF [Steroidobacteraceae bacterium]
MTLQQLIRVLWARRLLIVLIFVLTVAAGVTISLLMPNVYMATTALVVEQRNTDPITGNTIQVQQASAYLATQVDVISSHNVAAKVVDKMKLADLPIVQKQFLAETGGAGTARDWLADRLSNSLQVTPSTSSTVIQVSYSSPDANFAAQMANAFADAYIQTNLELKVEPAKRQSAWYQDQVVALRNALEAAQQKAANYQREKSVVSSSNRVDVENARLTELNSQLTAAQGTAADAQSRLRQMNEAQASGRLDQLPDILGNSLMQSMKADLARAEAKLAETAQRYDTGHPQYLASLAEVASLRDRLRAETANMTGAIKQSAELANQRIAELTAQVQQQKAKVLQFQQGSDALDVLQRDVDSAQRAYDAGLQRASQARMQSQLNETSVAVLNPAIVPLQPTRPRVLFNICVSILVGGLLGMAAAVFLELIDRRVRAAADIVEMTALHVLAEVPR